MQNTTEYLTEDQLNQEDAGRKIGIVMVKKEHIKSLQVKQNVILALFEILPIFQSLEKIKDWQTEQPSLDLSITGTAVTADQVGQLEAAYENKLNINLVDDD